MAEVQSLQCQAGDKAHGMNDLAFWEVNESCVSEEPAMGEKSVAIISTKRKELPAVRPSITHSLWTESSSSSTTRQLNTTWLLLMRIYRGREKPTGDLRRGHLNDKWRGRNRTDGGKQGRGRKLCRFRRQGTSCCNQLFSADSKTALDIWPAAEEESLQPWTNRNVTAQGLLRVCLNLSADNSYLGGNAHTLMWRKTRLSSDPFTSM